MVAAVVLVPIYSHVERKRSQVYTAPGPCLRVCRGVGRAMKPLHEVSRRISRQDARPQDAALDRSTDRPGQGIDMTAHRYPLERLT
ncbi:hypothetical protein BIV57_10915 [Mangrovactinospora gilvigrisea]|uniref:Uncharacterized protein n=1 Tax=Mangrovactinospora gilvigrisea TaxID=1428644 RepID=A0A1J7BFK8_9ACTN|nr:hypothetical protein BIV57_10915 [Mangrovactinospora gilvigrisea]